MSKIFLPLRSNSGWFVSQENRDVLERRIKNYILYYEEIIVQDGKYIYRGGENCNFDIFLPGNQAGSNRSKLDICKSGEEFGVTIGGQKLLWGTAEVAYETDFYPIFEKAKAFEKEYIKFLPTDIPDNGKHAAQNLANTDIESEDLKSLIPASIYQQKNVIESLYIDAIFSSMMEVQFLTDYRMAPVIQWKNSNIGMKFEKSIESIFQNAWVSIGLLDFGELPWDKVIELRESNAGQDFRNMIETISNKVEEIYFEVKTHIELERLVERLFSKELITHLRAQLPKPHAAFYNLALNLIPFGGGAVLGGGKDLKDLIAKRNSWVSFLEIESSNATKRKN